MSSTDQPVFVDGAISRRLRVVVPGHELHPLGVGASAACPHGAHGLGVVRLVEHRVFGRMSWTATGCIHSSPRSAASLPMSAQVAHPGRAAPAPHGQPVADLGERGDVRAVLEQHRHQRDVDATLGHQRRSSPPSSRRRAARRGTARPPAVRRRGGAPTARRRSTPMASASADRIVRRRRCRHRASARSGSRDRPQRRPR